MAKEYRIYPGIGIARLGNSPDSFFLSPEIPNVGPLEQHDDDVVEPVKLFKDGSHKLRRQAARFRIFEVNRDAAGNETFSEIVEGKFKGTSVYLGELRTDGKGRLMVLGGRGKSASIPAGQPLGDGSVAPGHPPNTFANNWAWYDDISDGPVTAVVRVAGQPDQPASKSAWVIVAPPDYAPYTNGITTLYDIAVQASGAQPPATPSFQNDVLPILKAASGLQWVSSLPIWTSISTDYATLSTKGTAAADQLRADTASLLSTIEGGALPDFEFTANQTAILDAWQNGNFVSDFRANPPAEPVTPGGLDRASLTQAVGGGFFPGIEAGIRLTAPAMYSSPFRITNQTFTFAGVKQVPRPGFLTRTMACPWQSDFFECEMQTVSSAWWPAQRPINVFPGQTAANAKPWTDAIPNHQALVDKFWMLGLVRPSTANAARLVETERDSSIPH